MKWQKNSYEVITPVDQGVFKTLFSGTWRECMAFIREANDNPFYSMRSAK